MSDKKLEFSAMRLVIDEKNPLTEDYTEVLRPVFSKSQDQYSKDGTYYKIEKENLDDKYYWLYACYGKPRPRPDEVHNIVKKEEEENPRDPNQVEQKEQLFALYDIRSHTLYLSSPKKKSWVEEYLKEKLEKDVAIKRFYKSAEEIRKLIKSVDKVRFVTERNVYSSESTLWECLSSTEEALGLGRAEEYTLEANFDSAKPTDKFLGLLTKSKNETKSLECIGRDDKDLETVFNADGFTKKVSVKVAEDDQGLYEPTKVKEALIKKVGELQ